MGDNQTNERQALPLQSDTRHGNGFKAENVQQSSEKAQESQEPGDCDEPVILQDEPEMTESPSASPTTTTFASEPLESPTLVASSYTQKPLGKARPPIRPVPSSASRTFSGMSGFSSQALSSTSSLSPPSRLQTRTSSGLTEGRRQTSNSISHRNSSFEYKETLDATTRHLEDGSRIINQYKFGKMIGQGAYGSVYRASLIDDPASEFAIKEFGKTRLRKTQRAQNRRQLRPGRGKPVGLVRRGGHVINSPDVDDASTRLSSMDVSTDESGHKKNGSDASPRSPNSNAHSTDDPLSLIRHEIAILKKLHHPHLVQLYEVLDDPSHDELYMVFEYCADGRLIDVKLHEQVEPLDENTARDYLVQIMLGVEYLHHHDIIHRDIKPDNILLQNERQTCKLVDFGVSEFFIKPGDDTMQKSAGSPAFMSPELCTAGRGDLHGKGSDVWSLGVTFYSMVVGHLPFDKHHFLDLYESIKQDEPEYPDHLSDECKDLLQRLLEKNPADRITIAEMRTHPFIQKDGQDDVLSFEENIKDQIDEVTPEEVDSAINRIASVFTLARAISRFKRAGSRASSAGSIGEITASILSKGKDVAHNAAHAAAPLATSIDETAGKVNEESARQQQQQQRQDGTTGIVEHASHLGDKILSHIQAASGGSKDRAHGDEKGKQSSSGEHPDLEHVAEAHVMLGTSNREWAAKNIARAVHKAKQHAALSSATADNTKAPETISEADDDHNNDDKAFTKEQKRLSPEVQNGAKECEKAVDAPAEQDNDESAKDGKEAAQVEDEETLQEVNERLDAANRGAPKVLHDMPTVKSPVSDNIPTPDGAADAYCGKSSTAYTCT